MKIAVIGTGYVGLVAGAGFSDFGHDVTCVDIDAGRIAGIERGEMPIHEPGLPELVARNVKAGRLHFTTSIGAAVPGAQLCVIAVGTPSAADGSADKVREAVASATRQPFAVASNPEFLKEGDAVNDFIKPARVIVGVDDERAVSVLRDAYAGIMRTGDRLQVMDIRSAELTKYAANAMLATRISFMNELARLAETVGADIEAVRKGIGSDPRIGNKFLFAGAGFGGSCFPKDLRALLHTARGVDVPLGVVDAVERANERQKRLLGERVVAHFGGHLDGKRVAVWGLAFKPETDDIRESPALTLIEQLRHAGATVAAYDPAAASNVRALLGDAIEIADDPYAVTAHADALVLVTEWHELRHPDLDKLKARMRTLVLFDGRNVWSPAECRKAGFAYYAIGRP